MTVLAGANSASLPSFACVVREGMTARLLVRGTAAAVAQVGGRRVRLFKPNASSWAEKLVENASEVMLTWEENLATPVHVVFFLEGSPAAKAAVDGPDFPPEQRPLQAPKMPSPAASLSPSVPSAPLVPPIEAPAEPAASDTLAEWSEEEPIVAPSFEPPPPPPASAPTSTDDFDFSHLIEETRFRGVEAAAVRSDTPETSDDAPLEAFPENADTAAL